MKKIMNKCPYCNGKLEYRALHQYDIVFSITSKGNLSKRKRKEDVGPVDCGFICCTECDFRTNADYENENDKNLCISEEKGKFYYERLDE